jgi:hypothetical protein
VTGYNRSSFRVERVKIDIDPESWDVFAGKITSNGGPGYAFLNSK